MGGLRQGEWASQSEGVLQGEHLTGYDLLRKNVTNSKKAVTMVIKITDKLVNGSAREVVQGPLEGPKYQYFNSLVSFRSDELTQKQRETDQVYQEVLALINAFWDKEEG